MNRLPSWLQWSLCALPLALATFFSFYQALHELDEARAEARRAREARAREETASGERAKDAAQASWELHSYLTNTYGSLSGALQTVGLLGVALILSFGALKSMVEGYEARIRRLEAELARREQPVP